MQLPFRKLGKYALEPTDFLITPEKFNKLTQELENLKKNRRPKAATEVARLAELGDFSENVEYQLAKGRLRGINNRITTIEQLLNQAEIIVKKYSLSVIIGSTVLIKDGPLKRTYQILGSTETNPASGIISHSSPVGKALMGKKVGEEIELRQAGKIRKFTILEIT